LVVAYAEHFTPPPYFTMNQIDELRRQLRESFQGARAALSRFVDEHIGTEAAAATGLRVVEGTPADGIRKVSQEVRADMIVLGTHGRGGVNRLMLGSVAERVLRESDIPVLTVRMDTASDVAPPKSILCPVNDTPAAREALSAAAHIARCFGGEVIAVHVREARAAQSIEDLCAWMPAEVRTSCAIRELTREGDAAEEIIALARDMHCDLLVVGARQRLFFDGTVLGSTTARVVRHAPCPVLTVKARRDSSSEAS
jgi:nucleotide-binding universal stress UspA family protein